jgi:hypothetical protein
MVLASPLSTRHLDGGEAPHRSPTVPLTATGLDKTGVSGF